MSDWRELTVENEFTIEVPEGAARELDDNGATFVVRLPTSPATEILISRYDQEPSSSAVAFLEGRVRSFLSVYASRASESELGVSVKDWCDSHNLTVVQGVGTDGEGSWWLVRCYDVGADYFMLHWTGPEGPLKDDVLRVFESFRPAERWLPKSAMPES